MTTGQPRPEAVDPATLEQCLATLRHSPAGLILDIDGTISEIAPTPADAFVSDAVRQTLRRLAHPLALVAVVSGRAAAVGAEMVGVDDMLYIGNHGMERRHRAEAWVHPGAAASRQGMTAALDEIAAEARASGHDDWMAVENKELSGTVHYRLAADPAAARAALLPLSVAVAERHGLIVTEGRLIIELRPSIVVNKGTAIVDLVAEHRLRGIVFIGDDLTDVDGFVALRTLREEEEIATLRVGVLAPETPQPVIDESDVTVPGVPAVETLLAAIADDLATPADER